MTLVAFAVALLAALQAAPQGQVVWKERFTDGRVAAREWTRCAQPWQDSPAACSAANAGGSEYLYWSPAQFGAGDTVLGDGKAGVRLIARRLDEAERARIATIAASIKGLPRNATLLAKAGWKSAWLQTRKSWGIDHRIAATFVPSEDPAAWFGLWLLNDPAHRRWPPEIDVAEVTNLPDGRHYVRQNVHWTDAAGKHQVDSCPATLDPGAPITAGVTRTATTLTFDLNGRTTCSFPLRPGVGDPMQAIVSLQVGGLGKPSTPTTPQIEVKLEEVRVERVKAGKQR